MHVNSDCGTAMPFKRAAKNSTACFGQAVRKTFKERFVNKRFLVVSGRWGRCWPKPPVQALGVQRTPRLPCSRPVPGTHRQRAQDKKVTQALFGEKTEQSKTRWEQWAKTLKEQPDGLEIVLREARQSLPRRGKRREAALGQIAYFERNTDKMRYAEHLARGLFIGSGVVESRPQDCHWSETQTVRDVLGNCWRAECPRHSLSTGKPPVWPFLGTISKTTPNFTEGGLVQTVVP
jgi:hypothetical protein